jgi:hypothetical protein
LSFVVVKRAIKLFVGRLSLLAHFGYEIQRRVGIVLERRGYLRSPNRP